MLMTMTGPLTCVTTLLLMTCATLGETVGGGVGEALLHRAVLDQRGAFVMLWTPLEDHIVIEIQVATTGYVGLGFSPNGGMKGSDVVIGWVDDQGYTHFQDRHAYGQLTPSVDASQDYTLLHGAQNDTHTTLRFTRPWRTCDTQHDLQLSGDTVRVIWAVGAADPTSERLQKHLYRGTKSLYLREPGLGSPPPAPHVRHWDIRSPKVRLPDDLRTLYWCKLYKIPDLPVKTHAIGYLPIIEEANHQHVHHMLLYECHLPNSAAHYEKFLDAKGAQCYDKNMPFSWSACNTPLVAWAVGSEGEMFPEHVGVPLGEQHGGATYFLLEIHYDNPNLRKGVVDASGLRVLHTDQLRQYEAGILTLGHTVSPTQIIPPGQKWTTTAVCPRGCTQKTLPEDGIKVFQGFLHAHLLGSSIKVTQIRKGRELPTVFKDMSYDFNYQQARVLREEMTVLPGDDLILQCGYDSTARTTPTFGGFSTEDEMCLAFLTYYPRTNLSGCYSRPDMALVFDTFGIHDLFNNDMNIFNDESFSEELIVEEHEQLSLASMAGQDAPRNIHLGDIYHYIVAKAPQKYYNRSFYDIVYDEETWRDEAMVKTLQEMVTYGHHEPACENHGRSLLQGLPRKVRYPNYISLAQGQDQCVPGQQDVPTTLAPPSTQASPITQATTRAQAPPRGTRHQQNPAPATPVRPAAKTQVDKGSLSLPGGAPSLVPSTWYLVALMILLGYRF